MWGPMTMRTGMAPDNKRGPGCPGPRLEIVGCGARSGDAAADVADATAAATRSAATAADTGNGAAAATGAAAPGRAARNTTATAAGAATAGRAARNTSAATIGSAGAAWSGCAAGLGFRGRRAAGGSSAGHGRRCRRRRRGGAAARAFVISAATGDGHDEHGSTAEGCEGSPSSSSHQLPISTLVLQGCLGRIPRNLRVETADDGIFPAPGNRAAIMLCEQGQVMRAGGPNPISTQEYWEGD